MTMRSNRSDSSGASRMARIGVVAALAAIAAIAACGGGSGSGSDATAAGAPAPAPSPAPASAAAPMPQPTAVGLPVGPAVTQVIGAAGGSLQSGDGVVTLTIPSGALPGDTVVGIQPIINFAMHGIGTAYRLTPEGTTFAQPVQLSFGYDDASVAGSAPEALEIATQDSAGRWHMAASVTRDLAARTVTATALHFSDWSRVGGLQLHPAKATVNVNGVQDLALADCVAVDDPAGTGLTYPLYDCDRYPPTTNGTSHWAVNGAPGGTTGLGLVVANGNNGRYTAPATVPAPNVVSVSAEVSHTKYGKVIIASNITVVGGGYAGSVDVPAGGSGGTIGAQHVEVTWTRADPDPLAGTGGATYYGTGGYWTALITPGAPCDPQTVTLDLAKGQNGTPASVLEVFGGAKTYRFVVATQAKTVAFNCNGVPAPTLIGQDITVGVCESDRSGTGAGAVPYTDVTKLASSGPAPAAAGAPSGCPPKTTATWSFATH